MKEYELRNASINIPYNDLYEIIKELKNLREFVRTTFWHCDTPNDIKTKANELNMMYGYWI